MLEKKTFLRAFLKKGYTLNFSFAFFISFHVNVVTWTIIAVKIFSNFMDVHRWWIISSFFVFRLVESQPHYIMDRAEGPKMSPVYQKCLFWHQQ